MRVSVIVAVYNGAERLRGAIDSILAQDLAPFEVIVVDDGSTDATPDVIASYGPAIRTFRQENGGPASARNLGLRHAGGDAIAFLDHDDVWTPYCLKSLVGLLQSDADIDIAVGCVEVNDESGAPVPANRTKTRATAHRPYLLQSLLIRRKIFDRIGLFDPNLTYGEDMDWFLRARDQGIRFRPVPEVTTIYRLHAGNMSRNLGGVLGGLAAALKNSLDRRRAK